MCDQECDPCDGEDAPSPLSERKLHLELLVQEVRLRTAQADQAERQAQIAKADLDLRLRKLGR